MRNRNVAPNEVVVRQLESAAQYPLNFDKLCRVEELDLIHNLELRELWLEGNPLHGAVESFSACYRLVTYFPTIEKLDGQFFKENLFFEPEEPQPLPQAKGTHHI
ncbi:nuclear RNA export factor 1-like [Phyllobates terribilis]|uniref:nuclear RNA export factor 1-like n=1 Tax=Phyllobates terribilis TaxID=111132 RepID=UPI003CCB591A